MTAQPTWRRSEYQLIDFGGGRKLERVGGQLYDRPCPAAAAQMRTQSDCWATAAARYERRRGAATGTWHLRKGVSQEPHPVTFGRFQLQIRKVPSGQLGIFPEQATNWNWLHEHLAGGPRPLKLLNLFAYTGGSTLAAATAGAHVVHVDASRSVIQWARENAGLSGMTEHPIRWIQEDVTKFVAREIKRGNHYDGVILDPPSYGHGPKGEPWSIDEALPALLQLCVEVTQPAARLVLITCHSPGYETQRLRDLVSHYFGDASRLSAGDLWLRTEDGRKLHCGNFARYAEI